MWIVGTQTVLTLVFFLQLLDIVVDTCPHRNHCWHRVSLLHVWPQVLLSAAISDPSHSYHQEAFKCIQSSKHWAHTARSVCLLCNKRRMGRVWKSSFMSLHASAPHRQFGKSLLNCQPFIVCYSSYACLIFTCTVLCSVYFSCPFCH